MESIKDLIPVNDQIMALSFLLLLVSVLIMGPYFWDFRKTLISLFWFNGSQDDVSYPQFSPFTAVVLFIVVCLETALLLGYAFRASGLTLSSLLPFLGITVLFMTLKAVLYMSVNSVLYKKQNISIKPTRWNQFFVSVVALAGFFSLVVFFVSVSLSLDKFWVLLLAGLLWSLTQIGLIFKLKTSLFRNKCSNSVFFLYLCALEIAPFVLTLGLLCKQ